MGKELENWLSYRTQKNTRNIYQSSARHFLNCTYGVGLNKEDVEYEELTDKYIAEVKSGRVWFDDLQKFGAYISNDGKRPPKTAQTYLYGVKSYLEQILKVQISKDQMKTLKNILPKGKRARTKDGDLTREKFRNILAHCDIKGKSLFLLLASSGIRVGEALELQPSDIDFTSEPVKISISGENAKEGDNYETYISSEAKEVLYEWLKVKDSYLQSSHNRGKGLLKVGKGGIKDYNDKHIFPFSMTVADNMWVNAIKKANLAETDSSTNRHKFHIHILRKFFNSQMKYAGVPDDMVEAMLGHDRGLSATYGRYSQSQFVEQYKKGEPYLLVNVPTEIHEIQTKFNNDIEKQKQEIDDLYRKLTTSNTLMIQVDAENKLLARKVTSLETLYNKLFEVSPQELRELMQVISQKKFAQQMEEDKKQST
jgi:integrase